MPALQAFSIETGMRSSDKDVLWLKAAGGQLSLGSCSSLEQAVSKAALRSSTPRGPACPDGVTERIRASEARGPGSSPGRDITFYLLPCECDGGTADYESARRGSTPRRGAGNQNLFSECAGLAHELAKLVDRVQFLARTLEQPDAGARRHGHRLQCGRSGFDSRRRLLSRSTSGQRFTSSATMSFWPAARPSRVKRSVERVP